MKISGFQPYQPSCDFPNTPTIPTFQPVSVPLFPSDCVAGTCRHQGSAQMPPPLLNIVPRLHCSNLVLFSSEPYHYLKLPCYLLSVSLQKEYHRTRTEPSLSHSLLNQVQSRLSMPDPIFQMMKLRLKKSSNLPNITQQCSQGQGWNPRPASPLSHVCTLLHWTVLCPAVQFEKDVPLPLAVPLDLN